VQHIHCRYKTVIPFCLFCGVCVVAKYGPCSSLTSDAIRTHRADVVKSEVVSECQHYNTEQPASASGICNDVADGTVAFDLSAEQDLRLTDILEVIDYDTGENCETPSTGAALSQQCIELVESGISSLQMTVKHVSAETEVNQSYPIASFNEPVCLVTCDNNSENTGAGTLMPTGLQSHAKARNPLAEAFARRLLSQPKKPS